MQDKEKPDRDSSQKGVDPSYYVDPKTEKLYGKRLLSNALDEYKDFLLQKLKKTGIIHGESTKELNEACLIWQIYPKEDTLLLNRYMAIRSVMTQLKGKYYTQYDNEDLIAIRVAVTSCESHKPDSSECSFLKRITSLLRSKMKPLFLFFAPKEEQLGEEVLDQVKHIMEHKL